MPGFYGQKKIIIKIKKTGGLGGNWVKRSLGRREESYWQTMLLVSAAQPLLSPPTDSSSPLYVSHKKSPGLRGGGGDQSPQHVNKNQRPLSRLRMSLTHNHVTAILDNFRSLTGCKLLFLQAVRPMRGKNRVRVTRSVVFWQCLIEAATSFCQPLSDRWNSRCEKLR